MQTTLLGLAIAIILALVTALVGPLLIDMDDADEVKRAKALSERLVERALAMDGTCTGEHGVGQGKMKYLVAEHGAAALAVMASIKRAIDPQNIMNPGKIVALS